MLQTLSLQMHGGGLIVPLQATDGISIIVSNNVGSSDSMPLLFMLFVEHSISTIILNGLNKQLSAPEAPIPLPVGSDTPSLSK